MRQAHRWTSSPQFATRALAAGGKNAPNLISDTLINGLLRSRPKENGFINTDPLAVGDLRYPGSNGEAVTKMLRNLGGQQAVDRYEKQILPAVQQALKENVKEDDLITNPAVKNAVEPLTKDIDSHLKEVWAKAHPERRSSLEINPEKVAEFVSSKWLPSKTPTQDTPSRTA